MIDREARDVAATLIASYASGQITNDDLEADWPEHSADRAPKAIYFRVWSFFSDTHRHRISTRTKASMADMEILHRMIFFLRNNLEYEWRDLGFHSFFNPVLFALKRGWLSEKRKTDLHLGDYGVWPFFRRTDYENCISQQGGAVS